MMPARAASAEPPKTSKRKGTRSVSTLTPSQLARKRANDREAQRAIRARTKEHIERLERELEEYRSSQGRDKTVQELLRRNRALEDELRRIKEGMGASITSSPYSAPAGTDSTDGAHALLLCQSLRQLTPGPSVYDDSLSVASSAMPSPQMSPLPSGPDYAPLPDYNQQQYVSLPKNCETWAAGITSTSTVGSPCSSVADADYGSTPAYIPTSMPTSMMHSSSNHGSMGPAKDIKMEFDDMHSINSQGYMHHQQQHHSPQPSQQSRPHAWNMYPMYYDAASPSA
ncbi:hypothetical protein HIM_08167 [Hirsutella minnesotensis 3608]|uniref:BZIP domain-containing protein n=1 Tax=Hirsutella minnesotensis 3608 TaxID=1043627 RepID=A0A0F7ZT50_9HYPO|nr:hypothetical protein HIM_08167 [Hirsutella minnesotensis 3608]